MKKDLNTADGSSLHQIIVRLKPNFFVVWKDIAIGYVMILVGLLTFTWLESFGLVSAAVAMIFVSAWIGFWIAYIHLFLHEAAHFGIHPSRRRNDLLANLTVGYLVFQPIKSYRTTHWAHHRNFDTPLDTEASYQNELSLGFTIASLTGYQAVKTVLLRKQRKAVTTSQQRLSLLPTLIFFLSLNLALYTLITFLLSPLTLFAFLLGQFCWMPFWGAFRQVLEHRAESKGTSGVTRQFRPGFFANYFGAAGFRNHLIHHWDPSISYTNLDELREHLEKTELNAVLAERTTTYFETIKYLCRK